MRRRIFFIATVMLLSAAVAQGQTAFLIAGGANAPLGHLGDIADIGYNASVGVNLGGTAIPVGARHHPCIPDRYTPPPGGHLPEWRYRRD